MRRVVWSLFVAIVLIASPSVFAVPPDNCMTADIQRYLVCGAICKFGTGGSYCDYSELNASPAYCYRVLDVTPQTCHEGQYDPCCAPAATGF